MDNEDIDPEVLADIEKRRRADLDVIRRIMLTKEGRAWFWRLLDRGHIFGSPFFGEETHKTAFAIGEENFAKKLWLDLQEASLDLYVRMVAEQRDEAQRLEKVRKSDAVREKAALDPYAFDNQMAAQPIDLPPPE